MNRIAEAARPFPALAERTACVVLVTGPITVPVTFTVTVQLAPAAKDTLLNMVINEPSAVIGPLQVLTAPVGIATDKPGGSTSTTPTPVSPTVAFGLVNVKVKGVIPFKPMAAAPKAFVSSGGKGAFT